MDEEIEKLFQRMLDPEEAEAYNFADKLGLKATEESQR